jgi:hypothetical protein
VNAPRGSNCDLAEKRGAGSKGSKPWTEFC